jgi:NTP pyrophosphatase (non-canonical NTP hydrolase)
VATLKDKPTLPDLQAHIQQVCAERGWNKNSITEIYLLFSEEIGELAKGIRNVTGLKGKPPEGARQNLEEEFADVLMYFMDLANYFGVDLESVYRQKIEVNKGRNWNS